MHCRIGWVRKDVLGEIVGPRLAELVGIWSRVHFDKIIMQKILGKTMSK